MDVNLWKPFIKKHENESNRCEHKKEVANMYTQFELCSAQNVAWKKAIKQNNSRLGKAQELLEQSEKDRSLLLQELAELKTQYEIRVGILERKLKEYGERIGETEEPT